MNKNFLDKETKKIIFKTLSKESRRFLKNGGTLTLKIERDKPLLRWGQEAVITLHGSTILQNSLVEYAWNNDNKQADHAISYFVYGDKNEYEITVI